MRKWFSIAALLGSVSTLVCCVLPALFVALGMGAVFAGLVSTVPQITWFSEHKVLLFTVAGTLLVGSGVLQWRARYEPCPLDPKLAEACKTARGWSRWVFAVSAVLYGIGFFFAFVAPRLFA